MNLLPAAKLERADLAPPTPIRIVPVDKIPWQPFREGMKFNLNPAVMCLWWVPVRDEIQVFTGRVAYWPSADCAMVRRASGSTVRVSDGCFFAIVTPPEGNSPAVIDDAIDVQAEPSTPRLLPPENRC